MTPTHSVFTASGRVLDLEADLATARRLATLMDAEFEIAGFKFGLDAVIGLVPVVGDALSTLVGLYPIHVAQKHGLGRALQLRMAANLAIDFALGATPIVGDAADAMFKAQLKNLELLEKAAAKRLNRR